MFSKSQVFLILAHLLFRWWRGERSAFAGRFDPCRIDYRLVGEQPANDSKSPSSPPLITPVSRETSLSSLPIRVVMLGSRLESCGDFRHGEGPSASLHYFDPLA